MQVDAVAIDDLPLPRPDWIKLDIEGHELPALRGMKRLFEADSAIGGPGFAARRPNILLEFSPIISLEARLSPIALLQWIQAHGYRVLGLNDERWEPLAVDSLISALEPIERDWPSFYPGLHTLQTHELEARIQDWLAGHGYLRPLNENLILLGDRET